MSARVAVVFHSEGGRVRALAEQVGLGARSAGATVELLDVRSSSPMDLARFDGFAAGCPTRFGSTSAELRAWLEGTLPLWHARTLAGRPAASFTVSGGPCGDRALTLAAINHVWLMHGCILVGNPPSNTNEDTFHGVGAKSRRPEEDGEWF